LRLPRSKFWYNKSMIPAPEGIKKIAFETVCYFVQYELQRRRGSRMVLMNPNENLIVANDPRDSQRTDVHARQDAVAQVV
jgi:hypothetical protein